MNDTAWTTAEEQRELARAAAIEVACMTGSDTPQRPIVSSSAIFLGYALSVPIRTDNRSTRP